MSFSSQCHIDLSVKHSSALQLLSESYSSTYQPLFVNIYSFAKLNELQRWLNEIVKKIQTSSNRIRTWESESRKYFALAACSFVICTIIVRFSPNVHTPWMTALHQMLCTFIFFVADFGINIYERLAANQPSIWNILIHAI